MSLTANDIDTMIANNIKIIEGYQSVLIADTSSPQATYTLLGETVSQNEWRRDIQGIIDSSIRSNEVLQKQRQKLSPWILTLRKRVI